MPAILLSIAALALFAYWFARMQAQLYWPFRELNDQQFDAEKKKQLTARAKRYGWLIAFALSTILPLIIIRYELASGSLSGWPAFFRYCLHAGSLGAAFWLVFDITFAKSFNQAWHYLGRTAEHDEEVRDLLGRNAGKWKALFCLTTITSSLLIIHLWL